MLKKRLGINAIERDWSWDSYFGSIRDYYKIPSTLIIPEGCREIGGCAFWCCHGLKKVVISEGVERIGDRAFRGCSKKLREVVISKSVERIEVEAFCYCYKATIILKKPRSMFKRIGGDAFGFVRHVKEETGN